MHLEAYQWLCHALDLVPYLLDTPRSHWRVLEQGSRDVNGSPRTLIEPCARYIGVDIRPGRGVDVVANAADTTVLPGATFDLVVCTEVMEHTADAEGIVRNAHRLLAEGGVYLVTCAGPSRPPHGADGGALAAGEYYGGISESLLADWLHRFRAVLTWDRTGLDTYALAVR